MVSYVAKRDKRKSINLSLDPDTIEYLKICADLQHMSVSRYVEYLAWQNVQEEVLNRVKSRV